MLSSARTEHQEEDGSRIDGTQHDKAVFSIVVQFVAHGQRVGVVESERSRVEVNTVLGKIRPAFLLVPLEPYASL
jgi:hypothetical protein